MVFVDPPGPPQAPKVSDITKESAVLTWEPPAEDGGTPITGYHVERRMTSSARWAKVCHTVHLPTDTKRLFFL